MNNAIVDVRNVSITINTFQGPLLSLIHISEPTRPY
mgnify:CR=1 FL=1